jgi:hypothetical protein
MRPGALGWFALTELAHFPKSPGTAPAQKIIESRKKIILFVDSQRFIN